MISIENQEPRWVITGRSASGTGWEISVTHGVAETTSSFSCGLCALIVHRGPFESFPTAIIREAVQALKAKKESLQEKIQQINTIMDELRALRGSESE